MHTLIFSMKGEAVTVERIREQDASLATHLCHAVTTGLLQKTPQENPRSGQPSDVYRGFIFAFLWRNIFLRLDDGTSGARRRASFTPGAVAGRST